MLSNIFKIAFRHLLHHPFYAVISIFGLAISISSTHCLALKNDGSIVSWGHWKGREIAPPLGLRNVIAICAGNGFSLALTELEENVEE